MHAQTVDPNDGLPYNASNLATNDTSGSPRCGFSYGFATLDGMIPDVVGGCLSDPRVISNGNTVQQTAGGLLSFNPADGFPEFTDGSTTWVLGPLGLQTRPNDQRFSYEAPQSNVAGVVITNKPTANVVGCLIAAINASGSDHPVTERVVFPPGNSGC